jgi:hypothetical protein
MATQMLRDLAKPGWEQAVAAADLVTMSALLDLTGAGFVERLAGAAPQAVLYAALTVQGRVACLPEDEIDGAVFTAFHRHMERDKGFGPALGTRAADFLASRLAAGDYEIERAPADWRIGRQQAGLVMSLLDGWIKAVRETGEIPEADLTRWARRRNGEAAMGSLELRVGHTDLLALPRRAAS